jgi:hypothetical protein
MKSEFSKRIRALLRQQAAKAYERELRVCLVELEGSFVRWRNGEIDAIALADEIDAFAGDPARRRLERRYNTSGVLHITVAQAIVDGILKAEEVPAELLDALGPAIEFCTQGLANDTISLDEEED